MLLLVASVSLVVVALFALYRHIRLIKKSQPLPGRKALRH